MDLFCIDVLYEYIVYLYLFNESEKIINCFFSIHYNIYNITKK